MAIEKETEMFEVGQRVRTKDSVRREGVVSEITEREVVVTFTATGELRNSPWGEFKDAGQEGHYFHAFAGRLIEAI